MQKQRKKTLASLNASIECRYGNHMIANVPRTANPNLHISKTGCFRLRHFPKRYPRNAGAKYALIYKIKNKSGEFIQESKKLVSFIM